MLISNSSNTQLLSEFYEALNSDRYSGVSMWCLAGTRKDQTKINKTIECSEH